LEEGGFCMPAAVKTVAIVDQGLVSAYGDGVSCCADGLLAGVSRLSRAGEAFSPPLREFPVGRVSGVEGGTGRLGRLLDRLFVKPPALLAGARVYVATTVGEIDFVEADIRADQKLNRPEYQVSSLAGRVAERLGLPASSGVLFSAACASSTAAVAMAASAIQQGEADCICVVGCDALSEFTLSGFATLMALDPAGARPFDAARKGVALGEAAAYTVLMSAERAMQEGCAIQGYITGWGMTCDANHLTGPSRDGIPLAEAVEQALQRSQRSFSEIVAICAHGTGTSYNDQMELLAFNHVLKSSKKPLFSVKGGMGHTLGAAGLVEMLLTLECLKRGHIPGTVGLSAIPPEAEGWLSCTPQEISREGVMVTTNSGFGGVNVGLLLSFVPPRQSSAVPACENKNQFIEDAFQVSRKELTEKPSFATPKNFSRFSLEAQQASLALAKVLVSEGLSLSAERQLRWDRPEGRSARVGLVVWNPEGSATANRLYFDDYVATGSLLGRGQLFAATLPTAVASEVAIALQLRGPLLYVAQNQGTAHAAHEVACDVIRDGLAEAMVLLAVHDETIHIVFMKEGGI
jgi:3-oxoacyl-(acyl-carrier-protein) synthase